ncbi:MAG: ABC transporter ATP-binding protein [Thermoplasmatota archaeon]
MKTNLNGNEMIVARNVAKTYETGTVKVEALRGVDLVIKKGEMVSIMGPSGCGKTTLLNCLSGLDSITGGEVLIEGMDIARLSDDRKTKHRARRMGFVFQFYNLLPVLTAVENVELPLLLSGVRPREARKKARKVLEQVGLGAWEGHMPAQLSGGQRQRVTIARALVNDPAIVFADEPTGDLDRKTTEDIMDLLLRLNRENGQTFVIVTHDQKVGAVASRQIRMVDGRIVKDNGHSASAPGRELAAA